MKVYDQTRVMKKDVEVVQHQIFNNLVEHIRTHIQSRVPGLNLEVGGKHASEDKISARIAGAVKDEDGQKAQAIDVAVAQLHKSLTSRSG